jgi:hypothetical protein
MDRTYIYIQSGRERERERALKQLFFIKYMSAELKSILGQAGHSGDDTEARAR